MQCIYRRNRCIDRQPIEVPNLLLISGWTRSWEHQFMTALLCQCGSLCMEQETWTHAISSKMHAEWSSFKLPVPHLGQDNMVRNNNMPYLWNSNYLGQWSRSMSHKSSVSGMGGAVLAIWVINEKKLLLILVGTNTRKNWKIPLYRGP